MLGVLLLGMLVLELELVRSNVDDNFVVE